MPNETDQRFERLRDHLGRENAILLEVVERFRDLDQIAWRMGLLPKTRSFSNRIPWWPLISVLGTYSAGKSSFINWFLGETLQRTGNQAVDDKFTVIVYRESGGAGQTLPGSALDSDIRLPFFGMSHEIEKVSGGEGKRIDAYVQLKTSQSPKLQGKILVDSPGFDADDQRSATLRLTDHILDLSDLVIVFFDARHPEPGAMRDTLRHLVAKTRGRADIAKFLYVLNQMDTTAREDNPEEVVAAWQRSLGEAHVNASRFYAIYNPDICLRIEDEQQRSRYEARRDRDLDEITQRIKDVEVARSYRIVRMLDDSARRLRDEAVPALCDAVDSWRQKVKRADVAVLILMLAALIAVGLASGKIASFNPITAFTEHTMTAVGVAVLFAIVLIGVHALARRRFAASIASGLEGRDVGGLDLVSAFGRSTAGHRSLLMRRPSGWTAHAERELETVLAAVPKHVQQLNDFFTARGASPASGGASSEDPGSG